MLNKHMRIAVDKNTDAVIGTHCNAYYKTIGTLKMLSGKIFYELFADHWYYFISV
jgi:hypothetical protein